MTQTPGRIDEATEGIFLGAAIGDALGWPQEIRSGLVGGQKERDSASPRAEFRSWIRFAGHSRYRRYRDPVDAGAYSDDTQLFLATARACLVGDQWWQWLTEVEIPSWPAYQRGGGGAVLAAASSWADGRPPWNREGNQRIQESERRYREAGANGVAMRIAPHVFWADTPDILVQRVVQDGITTHGHPRALVGALAYAFAVRHAAFSRETLKFGDSVRAAQHGLVDVRRIMPLLPEGWGGAEDLDVFAHRWHETNRELALLLDIVATSLDRGAASNPEATLEQLGCTDSKFHGSGTISAAGSIYLASRFAARPLGGLVSAAYLRKADTDTLASLTGALLGAVHGSKWLEPLLAEVQDGRYISEMAARTANRFVTRPRHPSRPPRLLRRKMRDNLFTRHSGSGEFPDGREYRLDHLVPLSEGQATRAILQLSDGQTAVVDLISDREPALGGPQLPQSESSPLGAADTGDRVKSELHELVPKGRIADENNSVCVILPTKAWRSPPPSMPARRAARSPCAPRGWKLLRGLCCKQD